MRSRHAGPYGAAPLPASLERHSGESAMRPRPAVRCSRLSSWTFTAGAGAARCLAIAAILCLLLPSGTLRAELPPAGTDVLNVAVTLQITVDPGPTEMVPMIGQMMLRRGIGDPNQIPIEIISLNLTGM